MAEALLHIGLGKTGTSSVQRALEALIKPVTVGKKRLFYPTRSRGAGLFSEQLATALYPHEDEAAVGEVRRVLENAGQKADLIILSGEIIAHSPATLKVRLLDLMRSLFERVTIIAYVRQPDQWNGATAAQLFIDGIPLSGLSAWPYLETQAGLLAPFREYARQDPNVRLSVSTFEAARERPGGLSEDFGHRLATLEGLEASPLRSAVHVNRSLDARQYIAIGRLNDLLKEEPEARRAVGVEVAALAAPTPQLRFGQYYAAEAVIHAIRYDAIALRSWFGIEYAVPAGLLPPKEIAHLADFAAALAAIETVKGVKKHLSAELGEPNA